MAANAQGFLVLQSSRSTSKGLTWKAGIIRALCPPPSAIDGFWALWLNIMAMRRSSTVLAGGSGRSRSRVAVGRSRGVSVGSGRGSGGLFLLLGKGDLSGHSLALLFKWDLWGHGQNVRLSTITILIGLPSHGHITTLGIQIGVAAAHHDHLGVINGLHLSSGLLPDAILCLKGKVKVLRLGGGAIVD
ncbi:hypothetical protein TCAL_17238 [Tigriopus californicus]|uniref:Uncharacterized protein n=1 Tax=Tigriopus californicus TaxID=6832 RepID=A0A553N6X5_TIGCA|nr:hypothetical protein TCAL_17238 [Tigriopus californicus]